MGKQEVFSPYADLKAVSDKIITEFSSRDARSFVLGFLRYLMLEEDKFYVEMKRIGYNPTYQSAISPKKGHIRSLTDRWRYEDRQLAFDVYFGDLIVKEAFKLPKSTPEEHPELYEARVAMASALYHAIKSKLLEL